MIVSLLAKRRTTMSPGDQFREEARHHQEDVTQEHSFDELAKALAAADVSRRRALRLVGQALLGGVLASIPGVAWAHHEPQHPIPPGQVRRCQEGEVKCRGTCCGPEDLCCNGVCTNVSFNRDNCGACGNVCQEGEDCCGAQGCVPLNTAQNCGCCGCGCLETEQCVFDETLQSYICVA
jgi:hypothetical protein